MPPDRSLKKFLELLATDSPLLARYNDPTQRQAVLDEFLETKHHKLLSDPSVLELNYTLELKDKTGKSAQVESKMPIFPPPIF